MKRKTEAHLKVRGVKGACSIPSFRAGQLQEEEGSRVFNGEDGRQVEIRLID